MRRPVELQRVVDAVQLDPGGDAQIGPEIDLSGLVRQRDVDRHQPVLDGRIHPLHPALQPLATQLQRNRQTRLHARGRAFVHRNSCNQPLEVDDSRHRGTGRELFALLRRDLQHYAGHAGLDVQVVAQRFQALDAILDCGQLGLGGFALGLLDFVVAIQPCLFGQHAFFELGGLQSRAFDLQRRKHLTLAQLLLGFQLHFRAGVVSLGAGHLGLQVQQSILRFDPGQRLVGAGPGQFPAGRGQVFFDARGRHDQQHVAGLDPVPG